ncbi:MAG: beta-phosphoglucomutase [Bacteroidota bacterium]|jgi:beta-phosphoglucomutase
MSHSDSSPRSSSIKAVIFDLDGVLVDTARYHDQAWEELATGFGYALTEADRHALKGRSRADSLEYILEQAGWEDADPAQKSRWLQAKNARYLELVEGLTPQDAAEGAQDLLVQLREAGIKLALGSASQNATKVLSKIGMEGAFDSVVDGTRTTRSKPDPQVFEMAASDLGLDPKDCLVIEDAQAGIEAALAGGFRTIGLGDPVVLAQAHRVVASLKELSLDQGHVLFEI